MFITFPFGKYQNFGWFQQFDFKMISRILEIFQPKKKQINYYKYLKEGWKLSNEKECENTEYLIKKITRFKANLAISANAVACFELVK